MQTPHCDCDCVIVSVGGRSE